MMDSYLLQITDIDECQAGTHLCNQTCANTNGSYMCECTDGYTLGIDRTSCIGKSFHNMFVKPCQK